MSGLLLIGVLVAYFLPTTVATMRRHRNGPAILILNLFLGWTFIGWVAALVWSATDATKSNVFAQLGSAAESPVTAFLIAA